jgi:hypothetical protein
MQTFKTDNKGNFIPEIPKKETATLPITEKEIRWFLQPAAEKEFILLLNAKLQGRGNPLPLRMEGHRGQGKTELGLKAVSTLMESRGWAVIDSPFPTGETPRESSVLAWLGKICQENQNTVIRWDEAECFPWEALKKLIENKRPVSFTFKGKESVETAVYDPSKFLWLLASNFSVDNGERGAGDSRTVAIPFLPLSAPDKVTLWKHYAKENGIPFTDETAVIGAANALPIGRDLRKQVEAVAEFFHHVSPLCDTTDGNDIREALIQRGYYPRGLRSDHITVLRFLLTAPEKRNGESYGYQLQDIRNHALAGRDESEVMAGLTAAGLVVTGNSSRKRITDDGEAYLIALHEWETEKADAISRRSFTLEAWQEWKRESIKPVEPVAEKPAKAAAKGKGGKRK